MRIPSVLQLAFSLSFCFFPIARADTYLERPPFVSYGVGDFPVALALADLNLDGRIDLITANQDSGDISVLFGGTRGGFENEKRISIEGVPSSLTSGDLDGDGRPDLVFGDMGSGEVVILYGAGNGSFSRRSHYACGKVISAVSIFDFNSDGRLDLAASDFSGDSIFVLLAEEGGRFQDPLEFPTGNGPVSLKVADINRDGYSDILTANRLSDDVTALFGRPEGRFSDPVRLLECPGPRDIEVADLNGDGFLDLAVASAWLNQVLVMRGSAEGYFNPEASLSVGMWPTDIEVADFNQDGLPDLLTADTLGEEVSVLFGKEEGGFKAGVSYLVGKGPRALCVFDLNNDGLLDICTVNSASNDVTVLWGTKGRPLRSVVTYAVGDDPRSLVVGDVNADGFLDIVVANRGSDSVSLLLNKGGGVFAEQRTYPVGSRPEQVDLGDLNQDGFLDFVTANSGSRNGSVYYGDPDLGFRKGPVLSSANVPFPAPEKVCIVQIGDINEDGLPDIVIGDGLFFIAKEDGTFDRLEGTLSGACKRGLLRDLNGDGDPEYISVGDDAPTGIHVLGAVPGPMFQGTTYMPRCGWAGFWPNYEDYTPSFAVGDLNGDGLLDLVQAGITRHGRQEIVLPVHYPLAAATFIMERVQDLKYTCGAKRLLKGAIFTGIYPPVGIADLDNDGLGEVLVALWFKDQGTFVVAMNGQLEEKYRWYLNSGRLSDLATGDLDGDGFQDVVVADADGSCVHILFNRAFEPRFRRGDANGDGKVNLSDALEILAHLYGTVQLGCLEAADANDDGSLNLADVIFILGYLFGGGDAPPAPGPLEPGIDPTPDNLSCVRYSAGTGG